MDSTLSTPCQRAASVLGIGVVVLNTRIEFVQESRAGRHHRRARRSGVGERSNGASGKIEDRDLPHARRSLP
jgi:hypothetical protein